MSSAWRRLGLRGRLALSIGTIVVLAFAVVFVAVRAQMSNESAVIKREEGKERSAPGAAAGEPSEGSAISPIEDAQSDVEKTFLAVGAASLLAALLAGYLVAARTASPLRRFAATATRVDAGDLTPRLEASGADAAELRTLAEAFNHMLDRLDHAFARQREFVSDASHELRSPLTSVQGFAELLMLERDSLTDKQAETVEIILDNCRHLARLLNDLLDLARSDAGRLAITPKPTAVAALIDDAVRTMRAQTETAHQTLTQRVEPGLPLVDVEADRIRQILVNLLTNAHDYSAEGASIEVTARPRGAEVEIAVTDDGPGIPESQLDLIFQRFTRGDAGLTQRVGGTGLGLAISKSLVELHGGTIEAESTVGVGSSFRFRLPATGVAAADPSAAATEAS